MPVDTLLLEFDQLVRQRDELLAAAPQPSDDPDPLLAQANELMVKRRIERVAEGNVERANQTLQNMAAHARRSALSGLPSETSQSEFFKRQIGLTLKTPDEKKAFAELFGEKYAVVHDKYKGDYGIYQKAVTYNVTPGEMGEKILLSIPEQDRPKFLGYVQQTRQLLEQGAWGKAGESYVRGAADAGYSLIQTMNEVDAYLGNRKPLDTVRFIQQARASREGVKGEGPVGQIMLDAAEMLPNMALGMALTTVNPTAGVAYWTAQIAPGHIELMRQYDVNDKYAVPLGFLTSIPSAMVEQMQATRLLPPALRAEARQVAANSVRQYIGRTVGRFGVEYTQQMGEEVVQTGIAEMTLAMGAYLDGKLEGIDWKERYDQDVEQLKRAAGGFAVLMVPGQAHGAAVDFAQYVSEKAKTDPEWKAKAERLTVENQIEVPGGAAPEAAAAGIPPEQPARPSSLDLAAERPAEYRRVLLSRSGAAEWADQNPELARKYATFEGDLREPTAEAGLEGVLTRGKDRKRLKDLLQEAGYAEGTGAEVEGAGEEARAGEGAGGEVRVRDAAEGGMEAQAGAAEVQQPVAEAPVPVEPPKTKRIGAKVEAGPTVPEVEWKDMKAGDITSEVLGVRHEIIAKGVVKKADAQKMAVDAGGEVWIDTPSKSGASRWAVVKRVAKESRIGTKEQPTGGAIQEEVPREVSQVAPAAAEEKPAPEVRGVVPKEEAEGVVAQPVGEKAERLAIGQRVRASDLGNIGTIVSIGKERADVRFRSKAGLTKTVSLALSQLEPLGKKRIGGVSVTPDAIGEIPRELNPEVWTIDELKNDRKIYENSLRKLTEPEDIADARIQIRYLDELIKKKAAQPEREAEVVTPEIIKEHAKASGADVAAEEAKPRSVEGGDFVSIAAGLYKVETERLKVHPKLQFKRGADSQGLVGPISPDKWDYSLGNIMTVWLSNDGTVYAVNGHHRRARAIRDKVPFVVASVLRESEGWTLEKVYNRGAELNIMEGGGDVYDWAQYFRTTKYTEEQAREKGLFQKGNSREAFFVGRHGSDDLYDLWRNKQLPLGKAAVIAEIAPSNASAQQLGIQRAKNKNADALRHFMRLVVRTGGKRKGKDETPDLLGLDPTYLQNMDELSDVADRIIQKLKDRKLAVQGALKRPETAKEMGLSGDFKNIQVEVDRLNAELAKWENWDTNPELFAKVEAEAGLTGKGTLFEEPQAGLPVEGEAGTTIAAEGFTNDTAALPSEGAMSVVYHGDVEGAQASRMNVGEIRRMLAQAEGPIPKIMPKLQGGALGRFRHTEGGVKPPQILLQADVFEGPVIVTGLAKNDVVEDVKDVLIQSALKKFPNLTEADIVVKIKAEPKSWGKQRITLYRRDPAFAAKVMAHEVGHWIDYVPDETTKRGNILGRLASLRGHLKHALDGLELKPITGELKALTQWWNPFAPKADPNYTKYRHSSKELYAEALSVLINDPAALEARAPLFYHAWFNYLEQKPEVKDAYEQTVREIVSGVSGDAMLNENYSEFARGEGAIREAEKSRRRNKEPLTVLGTALIDKHWKYHRWLDRQKRLGQPVTDARGAIDTAKYTESMIEEYERGANDVAKFLEKSGLTEQDFGVYLQLTRGLLAEDEGGRKAIPIYGDLAGAKKAYAALQKAMGKEKMAALEDARKQFRKLREDMVLSKIAEYGPFDKEFADFLMRNEYYSRNEVIDYLDRRGGEGTGLHIMKRTGTLKGITNPFSATIAADASLMWSVNWNHAKSKVAQSLSEGGAAQEAETKWNGKSQAPVDPKDPNLGLLTYMEDGKIKGVYIDRFVAQAFDQPNDLIREVASYLRIFSNPVRAWFTLVRPGFQLFNTFIRDPLRSIVNIKGAGLRPDLIYRRLFESLRAGVGERIGKIDPVATVLRERGLIISHGQYADLDADTTRLERELQRHEAGGTMETGVLGPIRKWWSKMLVLGNLGETANKRAAYVFMKQNQAKMGWSDEFIDHATRHWAGSPSFITGGSLTPITNNILLFSNAMAQGWRSDIEAFRQDPARVGLRRLAYNVMPKIVMIAFSTAGMGYLLRALGADDDNPAVRFADAMRRIFSRVSAYDMANYHIIPLGMTKSGKAVYLRLPQDESGRFIGGIVIKLFTGDNVIESLQDAANYTGGQTPGWSPPLTLTMEVLQYMAGGNPYDSFRERTAVPERIREVGGADSLKVFSKWLWNRYGGTFIYRFHTDNPAEIKTWGENMLQLPFAGDTVGRFIKISDYGLIQKAEEAKGKARVGRTGESLALEKAVRKDMQGESLSAEERSLLESNPKAVERKRESLEARGGGALSDALSGVGSAEEEAAVLREFVKMEGRTEAILEAVNDFAGRQLYNASSPKPEKKAGQSEAEHKASVEQWMTDTERAAKLLDKLPIDNPLAAFHAYWKGRGYKIGDPYYARRRAIRKIIIK